MAAKSINQENVRLILAGAVCVTVASQINIGLFANGFKVSAGILPLPVFAFYLPSYPVFRTAAVASPMVFLLRGLVFSLSTTGEIWRWTGDAPEMLFYLCYGLLLSFFLRKLQLHPVRPQELLPLAAADLCANFLELSVRMGAEAFHIRQVAQLVAVAAVRALLAAGVLFALERYGFTVLRRDDTRRYQRLLLMTSMLRGELAWMRKSASMVERTMNAAYGLYSRLREEQPDSAAAASALTIAKDIHEVKKEYMLIVRGVTEALEREATGDGMYFREIWDTLCGSLSRAAADAGKQVRFSLDSSRDFYTRRHYDLLSIFRNLLNNAVEAAGDAPVEITLYHREEDADFAFEVRDNCGGIPEDLQDKVFLEGFSSKINYATGEINRGLGLSLVRDLAEEVLGGSIRFESGGGGTVFFVRIPKNVLEETL